MIDDGHAARGARFESSATRVRSDHFHSQICDTAIKISVPQIAEQCVLDEKTVKKCRKRKIVESASRKPK